MVGYEENYKTKNNQGLIIPPPNPYIQAPGTSLYNQNNPAVGAGGGNLGWIAGAGDIRTLGRDIPRRDPIDRPPHPGPTPPPDTPPNTGKCDAEGNCPTGYHCHKPSNTCIKDEENPPPPPDTEPLPGEDFPGPDPDVEPFVDPNAPSTTPSDNAGVEGTSGWWTPPTADLSSPPGYEWAKEMYSPQLLDYINKMYGEVSQEPKSLEDMYQGFLEKNPALEQIQYNQALARLKGQQTASTESLNRAMSTRRGGAESGGYINSLEDIARTYGRGVQDIATNQAVRNMTEQEARQQNLIGYAGQDIANRQDWLGTMGGWAGQVMPFEQWNIQTPHDWAYQKAGFNLNDAVIQEQINAARRGETMGWLTSLMNWQNQLGSQYYTGQGQWGDYQNTRGGNILPGYGM